MRQLCVLGSAFLLFLLSACTEQGFVKVFECDADSPYFSSYTHKCYTTSAERDAADEEKKSQIESGKVSSNNNGKNNDDDGDDGGNDDGGNDGGTDDGGNDNAGKNKHQGSDAVRRCNAAHAATGKSVFMV